MTETKIPSTLNEQIDRLVAAGFAAAAQVTEGEFVERARTLQNAFDNAGDSTVLVTSSTFVPAVKLIEAIDRKDGKPQTVIHAEEHAEYRPIEGLQPPESDFYLIVGFDREPLTRNVAPAEALESIEVAGRSPLTLDEGLAVFAQWPECIWPNDGFSLAGSTRGDRRVPAMWISKKQPKLGWCFAGVPHTWLATASCSGRIAARETGTPKATTGIEPV